MNIIIFLLILSVVILIIGFFEIPLPFLKNKKGKDIYIPYSPIKRPGIISGKNRENAKSYLNFIKKHISNYILKK